MLFHSSVFSFFPVTAVQKSLTLFEACKQKNIHFSIDLEYYYILQQMERKYKVLFSSLTQIMNTLVYLLTAEY